MSAAEETVERAILFEEAFGYRRLGARKCIDTLLEEYDYAVVQVDVGLREAGPALFITLRFREDRFTDTTHAALVAAGEHAGGSVVALSDLDFRERGHFLSRFAECGLQRLGLMPEEVPKALDDAFSSVSERRATVRHPVEAPAVMTVGSKKVDGAVENLSAGGALVRTPNPPGLQSNVELEVKLPSGAVTATAKVVNVSERGVGLQFTPASSALVQGKLDGLPAAKLDVPSPASTLVTPKPSSPSGVLRVPTVSSMQSLTGSASPPVLTATAHPERSRGAAPPEPGRPSLDSAREERGAAPSAPAAPATSGPERMGPYELLSVLGSGGTSDVYFARVTEGQRMGEYVALKRLNKRRAQDPSSIRAFEAEARTLSLLKHQNIVRTLDTGVSGGTHYIVMEAIEGWDLGQLLRRCRARKKQVPLEVACFAVKTLLDALGAVHDAKDEAGAPAEFVHGDVSPHNLFVSKSGLLKLGDFGRTRRAGTRMQRAVNEGRPSYFSPEALDGEVEVSTDLWAAAVTLYELLTLEQPFTGNTLDELTRSIRTAREKPLRERRDECSGPLEAVLKAALEKDRKRRIPTAKAFAAAIAPHFHPVRAAARLPSFIRELFTSV